LNRFQRSLSDWNRPMKHSNELRVM
jgi:hypothetical protein